MHVLKGVAKWIRIGLGYCAYIEASKNQCNIAMYLDGLIAGFTFQYSLGNLLGPADPIRLRIYRGSAPVCEDKVVGCSLLNKFYIT